jgi:hypothetical protein
LLFLYLKLDEALFGFCFVRVEKELSLS